MGQMIELKTKDRKTISAYRAEPPGKPRGGLVVIQEIWGVNSHIRNVADGYAADGYLVIAPALFDRVMFPELMQLGDDSGAKTIIRRYPARVESVPFPEGYIDIDTPQDRMHIF